LLGGQRDVLDAGDLTYDKGLAGESALVNRQPAEQIGQCKGSRAVAAVGGSKQGVQRIVLVNRHQRAVAGMPVQRREIPCEQADFADKGIAHDPTPPSSFALLTIRLTIRSDTPTRSLKRDCSR